MEVTRQNAQELLQTLQDLNTRLVKWCELSQLSLLADAADIPSINKILSQRESLMPGISLLTRREASLREALADDNSDGLSLEIDKERKRAVQLGKQAAELDSKWMKAIAAKLGSLSKELTQMRTAQKAGRAYRPAGQANDARFLDQST